MTILSVIFFLLTLLLSFFCYNLFKQNQQLEQYLQDYSKVEDEAETFYKVVLGLLIHTQTELDRVDKRGSFSSDDEVGFAFKAIHRSIETCVQQLKSMRENQGQ